MLGSVRALRGGPRIAAGADGPQHAEQPRGDAAGPRRPVRPPASGPHAAERPPQPHELQHAQTHAPPPGCEKRPSRYRPGAAGGRNGRKHAGAFVCWLPYPLLKVRHGSSHQLYEVLCGVGERESV